MGAQKRLLEEASVCPECGADMSENEEGELECDGWDCMTTVDRLSEIDDAEGELPVRKPRIEIRWAGRSKTLRL